MFFPASRRFFTTASHTPLKGYKKYAEKFKAMPGSYFVSFAMLHELTAIAPFPFIYYALDSSSLKVPLPETYIQEGNKFINRVRVRYGYENLEPNDRTMVNLVSSYCIIKVLLPVRLLASAAMTPFFAEKLVLPIVQLTRKIIK
ncbi:hypothetical protein BY458DRAFT_533104 [Sporodiniella umbellata]|nr:hypothetical protein BY458DRAFT_533104 [Sporodiniella umbellata]